jgi:hypothetical protein
LAEKPRRKRRLRWLGLVGLGGVGVYVLRSRRSGAAALLEQWPSAPEAPVPEAPVPEAPVPGPPDPAPVPAAAAAATRRPSPQPRHRAGPEPVRDHGPGSAEPLSDGSAPGPEYTIKGNADSMLFHRPGGPYFTRTRAEVWFRTATDARAAGFTEAVARKRGAE